MKISIARIEKVLAQLDLTDILYSIKKAKETNSIYVTVTYKSETSTLRFSDHASSRCKTIYVGGATKQGKIERSIHNQINKLKNRYLLKIKL